MNVDMQLLNLGVSLSKVLLSFFVVFLFWKYLILDVVRDRLSDFNRELIKTTFLSLLAASLIISVFNNSPKLTQPSYNAPRVEYSPQKSEIKESPMLIEKSDLLHTEDPRLKSEDPRNTN